MNPDPDAKRVGFATFCRIGICIQGLPIRIRPIRDRLSVPRTSIFFTCFHENFNMLSKILKIMTPLPLMRQEKHCKLAFLRIKVSLLSYFPTCVKLGEGSACVSASFWWPIRIWIGINMEIRIRISIIRCWSTTLFRMITKVRKWVNYLEFRATEFKLSPVMCAGTERISNFLQLYFLFSWWLCDLHWDQKPPCITYRL